MQKHVLEDIKKKLKKLKKIVKQAKKFHKKTTILINKKKKLKKTKKINNKPKIKFISRINIRITKNNIFCTFLKKKKIKHAASSGKYKLHISKKFFKINYKKMLFKFFKKIKKKIRYNSLHLKISCPKRFRKRILRLIIKLRKQKFKIKKYRKLKLPNLFLIQFQHRKCLNGCRPQKKIRKKRRRFRKYQKKIKKTKR
jgi:hypothetical protein